MQFVLYILKKKKKQKQKTKAIFTEASKSVIHA